MTEEDLLCDALYDAGYTACMDGAHRTDNPMRVTPVRYVRGGPIIKQPHYLYSQMWDGGWEDAYNELARSR